MELKTKAVNIVSILALAGVVGYGVYHNRVEPQNQAVPVIRPQNPPAILPVYLTLQHALARKSEFANKTARTYTKLVIAQKRHDQVRGPFLVVLPIDGINPGDWPANVANLVVVKTDWDTYNRTAMGITAELKGPVELCQTAAFGKLPVLKMPAYKGVSTFDLGRMGISAYFWHGECGKDCPPPKPDEKPAAPNPQYVLNVDFLNGLFTEMLRCTE